MEQACAAAILLGILFILNETEREQRRRRHLRNRRALALAAGFHQDSPYRYAQINRTVPVLCAFFDVESDTKIHFCLRRQSLNELLQLLHEDRHHVWGRTIEILRFLFWLASGASYRVVSCAFGVPKNRVYRAVKLTCNHLLQHLQKYINLPKVTVLDVISEGLQRLGRHAAMGKAAGAIDGCRIRIKAPGKGLAPCYNNQKLYPSMILL